jgi:hypothetical protein
MRNKVVDSSISPVGHLDALSRGEINKLLKNNQGNLYQLFRSCALAVLASGNDSDDGKALLEQYRDFDIQLLVRERGIKLEVIGAPAEAFVDGVMINGIAELLFSVMRDILYGHEKQTFPCANSEQATDAVFKILRNAKLIRPNVEPNIVVCWGGHSIRREEYNYTKKVGYELGLRGLDICTGCGPGAMKGPMKGATISHAKQRRIDGRYIGLTEPGIIAAESPNPIVNELVILPDIEKRLEAFVRIGHGFIVFPGGAGTAEEILYLLGILLDPANEAIPFPLIFTGPESAREYFQQIDDFIAITLGAKAQQRYQIIIDDQRQVASAMRQGISDIRAFRKREADAYNFNWLLRIDHDFQKPFQPDHNNMAELKLNKDQPAHKLAANLRRAFSGIVAGNVKDQGIRAIEQHGPFKLQGEPAIMEPMDKLLQSFVRQQRMKLPGSDYHPCYQLVK